MHYYASCTHNDYYLHSDSQMSQRNVCDEAGIPYKSSHICPSNPVVNISELTSDEMKDLIAQISSLSHEIHVKFLNLKENLIESLKGRVSPTILVITMMYDIHVHNADDLKGQLGAAREVEEVFNIMEPYYSYYNYDLIEMITYVHGTTRDKQSMQQYVIDFDQYCRALPCEEEIINDGQRTKIKLLCDFGSSLRILKHDDIRNIRRRISGNLGIRPQSLHLHQISGKFNIIIQWFIANKPL